MASGIWTFSGSMILVPISSGTSVINASDGIVYSTPASGTSTSRTAGQRLAAQPSGIETTSPTRTGSSARNRCSPVASAILSTLRGSHGHGQSTFTPAPRRSASPPRARPARRRPGHRPATAPSPSTAMPRPAGELSAESSALRSEPAVPDGHRPLRTVSRRRRAARVLAAHSVHVGQLVGGKPAERPVRVVDDDDPAVGECGARVGGRRARPATVASGPTGTPYAVRNPSAR